MCVSQGNCRDALDLLDRLERSLRGHEVLAFRRAQASNRLAQKSSGDEAQEWANLATQAARYAVGLADQQSWEVAQALQVLTGFADLSQDEETHVLSLDQTVPPNPYWQPYHVGAESQLQRDLQRLNFQTSYFQIAQAIINRGRYYADESGQQQLVATLEGRFIGNADKTLLEADGALTRGEGAKAASLLEGAIQRAMPQWQLYMKLGTLQFEQGHYDKALATYLRYPGFAADSGESAIAIDNAASDAAAKFFWRGLPKEARALCAPAARTSSGSEGDMQCEIRMALLDGDFVTAARGSIERATRYRSVYAFRDYLSMLFAFNEPDEAWRGFAALAQRFETPQVWAAADVGTRMAERSDADVRAWLRDDAQRPVSFNGVSFAGQFALQYYAIDRDVPEDLASFLGELQGPVTTRVTSDGMRVVRSRPAPGHDYVMDEILGPSHYRGHAASLMDNEAYLPLGVDPPAAAGEARGQVVSDLELFATGYRALRQGDDAQAAQAFEDYARYYEPAVPRLNWVLPYLAAAIAPSEGRAALQAYLDSYKAANRRFDWHLAEAFVAVASGEVDAALEHLDRALDQRPHTEARPIATQYQWAEACEWLWQRTKDPRFQARLLTWARQTSLAEPYVAWPHAMLAQYSASGAAREAALGMALYLDPLSSRLRNVPEIEKQRAQSAFKRQNPFALARDAQRQRGT